MLMFEERPSMYLQKERPITIEQKRPVSHYSIDKSANLKNIVQRNLNELVLSLCLTGLASIFVATSEIPTLLIGAVSVIGVNILIRNYAGKILNEIKTLKAGRQVGQDLLEQKKNLYLKIQYLSPLLFSLLYQITAGVLVHEGGHFLAASTVYKKPEASIQISPFNGGATSYSSGPLTEIGRCFGENYSKIIITAAGPALAIILSTIQLATAHFVKDRHPKLNRYLVCVAITNIAQHVVYALTAFKSNVGSGHDFAKLWTNAGIHPLVSVISMVALPLIVQAALLLKDKFKQSQLMNGRETFRPHIS